jgi:hypothetical protein
MGLSVVIPFFWDQNEGRSHGTRDGPNGDSSLTRLVQNTMIPESIIRITLISDSDSDSTCKPPLNKSVIQVSQPAGQNL